MILNMQTRAVLKSFALTALFVATECFVARYSPQLSLCDQRAEECSHPLRSLPLFRQRSDNIQAIFDDIDSICLAYESTAECFKPEVHLCGEDAQVSFNAAFSVGDFACSNQGKSLLNQLKESVCVTDPTKLYELQGYVEICTFSAINNSPEEEINERRCQLARDIQICLVRRVREECGEAAAQLVEEIANRVLPVVSRHQCSVESANEQLRKRFEDFFSRRSL